MKDIWRNRYTQNTEIIGERDPKILTGFNAHVDLCCNFGELGIDLKNIEAEKLKEVKNKEELSKVLKYCKEKEDGLTVRNSSDIRFDAGFEKRIGGQGGVFANFLSKIGVKTVFYTPMLSDEVVELLDKDIEFPVRDGSLVLKRGNVSNTDQTRKDYLIGFGEDETNFLRLSGELKGFGPYFRKGIEEKFDVLGGEVDRAILSGFHDAGGNFESKLDKSKVQMRKLDVPKHLEYASMEKEKLKKILEDLLPEFDSIGLNQKEARKIADRLGIDCAQNLTLEQSFNLSREIIEEKGLERVHIHTQGYQVVVVEEDYGSSSGKIRDAILLGVNCAMALGDTGEIPGSKEMMDYSLEDKHVRRLDDLEEFERQMELENFTEEGTAEIGDLRVIAAPALIHEDPERVSGMEDIISSCTFAMESR